jgi:hypothetical protein
MNYPTYLAYLKAQGTGDSVLQLFDSQSDQPSVAEHCPVHGMYLEFDGVDDYQPQPQSRPLYFSKVEMEELAGGLEDHANILTMRDLLAPRRVSMVKPRSIIIKRTIVGKNPLSYVLTLESYVYPDDLSHSYEPWLAVSIIGGEIISISPSAVETTYIFGKNLYKIVQHFDLKLSRMMSCVQFYCNVKRCKYESVTFKEGHLINVFIINSKAKNIPNPPMISMTPWFDQTYVPMNVGQKLQVITNFEKYSTDISFNSLNYNNDVLLKNGHSGFLSSNSMKAEFFTYFRETIDDDKQADKIVVQSREMPSDKREIIIPAYKKGSNYPIVVEPDEATALLHAKYIDGFVYRSYNRTVPIFHKDCKFKVEDRTYTTNCLEFTIKIEKKDEFYYIVDSSDTDEGLCCIIRPH